MDKNGTRFLLQILKKWKTITFISLILTLASIIIALVIPNKYTSESLSEITLYENKRAQNNGLSSILGGALTGVNTQNGEILLKVLFSRDFVSDIFDSDDMIKIIASKKFDQTKNILVIDSNIYDSKLKKWQIKTVDDEPPLDLVYKVYRDTVKANIEDDAFLRVSVQHYSPIFAWEMHEKILYKLDEYFKNRSKTQAQKSIDFLQEKIVENKNTSLDKNFAQLLTMNIEKLMLSDSNNGYSIKVIDKPKIPYKKSYPNRTLLVIFAFLTSIFFSVSFVLMQYQFKIKFEFKQGFPFIGVTNL